MDQDFLVEARQCGSKGGLTLSRTVVNASMIQGLVNSAALVLCQTSRPRLANGPLV